MRQFNVSVSQHLIKKIAHLDTSNVIFISFCWFLRISLSEEQGIDLAYASQFAKEIQQ